VDRILVAGEPELETEEQRQRDGIPLHPAVAHNLRALGLELNKPPPL
jgi:LDH2 family malate/lactate/ureidoglycolate dehydrogenase